MSKARTPIAERQLVVTGRLEHAPRLDQVEPPAGVEDPGIEILRTLAAATDPSHALWITGGEPTLRSDLPALVRALAETRPGRGLGLVTDGHVLSVGRPVATLREAGLGAVRVTLHSPRPEAHDWLTGRPGSAQRALRALRACVARDLPTEIEATVTRVNATHLAELVELAARVHVRGLRLRRLVRRGHALGHDVMLLPRFGLTEPELERAVALGVQLGIDVSLEGFPPCATGAARAACLAANAVVRLAPEGPAWNAFRSEVPAKADTERCPSCPGLPACGGAPADYVARFGLAELLSEGDPRAGDPRSAAAPARPGDDAVAPPAPRAGRTPATRVRVVAARASRADTNDPATTDPVPEHVHLTWGAPTRLACDACAAPRAATSEPSRAIKLRLARCAQQGAHTLCIDGAGSLEHPDALDLFKDISMLSFARVEVACDGRALDAWSPSQRKGLKKITRLDVALYGPDAERHDAHAGETGAFAATLRGLARLSEETDITCGAFAVLHDADDIADYADAWQRGVLPGRPQFRLSSEGGSLEALAAAARMAPSPTRDALAALVPPCLLERPDDLTPARSVGATYVEHLRTDTPPAGIARFGHFAPCRCGPILKERCPGRAIGWDAPDVGE